ncbi:tumor necrosis factor receptor superfamily member 10B-like [Erythrolamprus reginae]|uniref:tumor necrosis factor receptor superfamily member 10B-like n=1 Tax=Erythrolamprus reginae TaxID=121349 RepID=UPI00396CB528
MAEAVAVVALLAAFSVLRKVESPILRVPCDPGEFLHSGICCKLCPAGTHVEEFCTFPQTPRTCKSCIDGESYTDYDNGLQECFSCTDCKPGYKRIAPCTRKKNTECQCNDDYFRPEGLEECLKCKTRCPEGQVVIESCNATTDMKCGPPYPEASDSSSITNFIVACVFVLLFVLVVVIIYITWKLRKPSSGIKEVLEDSRHNLISDNNETINATTDATAVSLLPETVGGENLEMGSREQDNVLPNRPSVSSPLQVVCSNGSSGTYDVQRKLDTSRKELLKEAYFQIKNIVPSKDWNLLMRRCGLEDNDIDGIKNDYASDFGEQHYRMLKTLQDKYGTEPAFHKIFAGLQEMKLNGIYECLINELESKDLIIKET